MTLNEYQQQAMTTCTDTSRNFAYMALNLIGEVGEFMAKAVDNIISCDVWSRIKDILGAADDCGRFAKMIRRGEVDIETSLSAMSPEQKAAIRKEAGDILWQLQGLCTVMGWSLEEVAKENLEKLADRKKRDTIVGEGDER